MALDNHPFGRRLVGSWQDIQGIPIVNQRFYFLLLIFAVFPNLVIRQSTGTQTSTETQPSTFRVESGVLGENTDWSTPWFRIDSGVKGPTVLVVG